MKLFDLSAICNDEVTMILWLRDHNLLKITHCSICEVEMKIANDVSKPDGCYLRCANCKSKQSVRSGSHFFGSKLSLKKLIHLVYFWTVDLTNASVMKLLGIDENTVGHYFELFRKVCSWQLERMDLRVGGEGKIVQIDESVVYKAKHKRGHALYCPAKWIMGLYDVDSKTGVALLVENRKSKTLLPLISKYVKVGTKIHSDEWRSYKTLSNLGGVLPFIHKTVKHKSHFKDPLTGVHTNNVESYWSRLKSKFKILKGTSRKQTPSYINEHMYRERFNSLHHEGLFLTFVMHLSEMPI